MTEEQFKKEIKECADDINKFLKYCHHCNKEFDVKKVTEIANALTGRSFCSDNCFNEDHYINNF